MATILGRCHTHNHGARDQLHGFGLQSRAQAPLLDRPPEESVHYQDNSRLSCQVVLTAAMDNLHVAVAPMEG